MCESPITLRRSVDVAKTSGGSLKTTFLLVKHCHDCWKESRSPLVDALYMGMLSTNHEAVPY